MIRLNSAVELANSLSVNETITFLDLSCNSLGRDGGEALGIYQYILYVYIYIDSYVLVNICILFLCIYIICEFDPSIHGFIL
jgi:hypothetical protein